MNDSTTPRILWFFGLPSAGKTTLANALIKHYKAQGQTAVLLDGDQFRSGICRGLGFSDKDREENIRRAAEMAKLLAAQGLLVACAFITPNEKHRCLVRSVLGRSVALIYVECPLEICALRDVKGLYRQAAEQLMTGLTGAQAPFMPPDDYDLAITTHDLDAEACIQRVIGFTLTAHASDMGAKTLATNESRP